MVEEAPDTGKPDSKDHKVNRKWIYLGLALVVVVAGVVVGFSYAGGDKPPRDETDNEEPSTREVFKVLESGYSETDDKRSVSYGAVLENISSEYVATVTIDIRVVSGKGNEYCNVCDIDGSYYNVVPGQRIAAAGVTSLVEDGDPQKRGKPSDVADLEVDIELVSARPYSKDSRYGKVETSDISLDTPREGAYIVSGSIDSQWNKAISTPEAHMILRNSEGDIAGGSLVELGKVSPGKSHFKAEEYLDDIAHPATFDVSRTEVYVGSAQS